MANIRWRPLAEVENWFEELGLGHIRSTDLAADIYEDDRNVYVEIHIPGINPENIDISVHHEQLRVTGSREEEKKVEERDYYHREIRRGSFERTLSLPCEVDERNARAEFHDGVLSITLPKKAEPAEHKIRVERAHH